MSTLTEADLKEALLTRVGTRSKSILDDPKAFKATFDMLKATMATDRTSMALGMAAGATSFANAGVKANATSATTRANMRAASMAMSTFKASMDLTKIAKLTSVGGAVAFIGATTIQKTGLAVSLVGSDNEQAKCLGAIMELAGSATVTVLTAPTGVLLVLSLASLTASAISAHQSCQAI